MKPQRLQEIDPAAPIRGPIRDAEFVVVRERRRPTLFGRIWAATLTLAGAALAGFLAPPLVMAVQSFTAG